ncbi:Dihydropyrimidinase [Rasamsonia emersonii CBS 393.64]|uniref:dihydropyrimidinase n=1 Tax=Rasamsonia emersonii (strain ATCC 16479 / CBS 393.64 / IMI 116815) TaxID=1408163 RepID=A0A0F4YY15_RASE3|nr:Dihydropyrimidinase [Rasamsonia emersonii CBS 393.64]KKA23000.1 Dihydropyrimidinase [Rasamsonia emersonii CBS 393.64]
MKVFPTVDLIICNATIATASDVLLNQDIAVSQGKIVLLGQHLTSLFSAAQVIDAEGAYVTPGGVDSHAHLDQDNSVTGDTFETGTRSAVAGGTTTVFAFATQKRSDESVIPVVEDYHRRATGNAYCDYGFHLILTNPTNKIVDEELPTLVTDGGITSVKLYMTYEPLKLGDREILDVMECTRRLGMTTMVHAENSEMINWITEKLEARKMTEPYYHAVSRPKIAEDEATYRVISLSELIDIPILIVHMSSRVAVSHVRKAQTRLLPIHAETCPHYLFLTSERLKGEIFEGAKCVCSPPLREDPMELEEMWKGLSNGTFTTFSSDHAPSKFDHPQGKKAGLVDGTMSFKKIPNGLPGVETRMATLFCGGVLTGRISIQRFVELTSSNPAKLYGLGDRKGTIAPGYDADFASGIRRRNKPSSAVLRRRWLRSPSPTRCCIMTSTTRPSKAWSSRTGRATPSCGGRSSGTGTMEACWARWAMESS